MKEGIYTGLDAEFYDELLDGEMDDLPFWRTLVKEVKGRSLEVGCGTGRILFPLLKEGLEVDGMDISEHMISLLHEKTSKLSFETNVRVQAMETLDMGRSYSLIFIPGFSLQMAEDRDGLLQALRACNRHLVPGGKLAVSLFFPWEELEDDEPGEWRLRKKLKRPDGARLECFQSTTVNSEKQQLELKSRYTLLGKSKELLKEEIHDIQLLWFYPHEFHLLLEETGFEVIDTFSEYTNEPMDEYTPHAVFIAEKSED